MSKEKVLHNPIKPRKKEDGDKIWSFKAPSYDNRTSCSVSAGNDYGVGFRTPVGRHKARSLESGPICPVPYTFKADDVIEKRDNEG